MAENKSGGGPPCSSTDCCCGWAVKKTLCKEGAEKKKKEEDEAEKDPLEEDEDEVPQLPRPFVFCRANVFRAWKFVAYEGMYSKAMHLGIQTDKMDNRKNYNNARRQVTDLKHFLKNAERARKVILAECTTLNLEQERERFFRKGLEVVTKEQVVELHQLRETVAHLTDEQVEWERERRQLRSDMERAQRDQHDAELTNKALAQQIAATNTLLQQEKEARAQAAEAAAAASVAAQTAADAAVAQLHKQLDQQIADHRTQVDNLQQAHDVAVEFQKKQLAAAAEERESDKKRSSEFESIANLARAKLATQEEEVVRLRKSGSGGGSTPAGLADMIERQEEHLALACQATQALTAETKYMREQKELRKERSGGCGFGEGGWFGW